MTRWHRGRGTKSNIVYHSIMFAICFILFIISFFYFLYVLLNKEFYIEILICVSFILFSVFMHGSELHDCTKAYVQTADYRYASQSPTTIDRLINHLVNHYNKRWVPAPYMCCSFSYLDPKTAHEHFTLSLIIDYGKRWVHGDTHCCLYRCNKCHKFVLAVESVNNQQYVYMPVKSPEDADDKRKDLDLYSIRTLRPVLHGYEDFWTWENKDYTGHAD